MFCKCVFFWKKPLKIMLFYGGGPEEVELGVDLVFRFDGLFMSRLSSCFNFSFSFFYSAFSVLMWNLPILEAD